MKPNWTAIIMTGLTVLVGLTCFVLALTLGKDNASASAILFSTGGAALGSFFKQPHKISSEARDTEGGHAMPSRMFVLLFAAAAALAALAVPSLVRADGWETVSPGVYKSGAWVAHPNFTVSAGQINVKDAVKHGVFSAEAVERVALAGGYGITYHGSKVTMGAGLYLGAGISAKTPNAPQASLLFTLYDAFATGPGVQRVTYESGTVAYQMLWTLGLNYAAGGTVSKVAPWFNKLLDACVTGAACAL